MAEGFPKGNVWLSRDLSIVSLDCCAHYMQELSEVLLPEAQSQVIGRLVGKLQPFRKQKCVQTPHYVMCTIRFKQLATFDVLDQQSLKSARPQLAIA